MNRRQHAGRAVQGAAAIPPSQATIEGAADQRRGDIKVHKDGTTWDWTWGGVPRAGADTTPGVAAAGAAEEYQERQIR